MQRDRLERRQKLPKQGFQSGLLLGVQRRDPAMLLRNTGFDHAVDEFEGLGSQPDEDTSAIRGVGQALDQPALLHFVEDVGHSAGAQRVEAPLVDDVGGEGVWRPLGAKHRQDAELGRLEPRGCRRLVETLPEQVVEPDDPADDLLGRIIELRKLALFQSDLYMNAVDGLHRISPLDQAVAAQGLDTKNTTLTKY